MFKISPLLSLLLILFLDEEALGDICDRSCLCTPKHDPIDVRCSNASIHIIPQDLPPYIEFLDLKENSIIIIESTLSHYEELILVDLSHNLINTIRPRAFSRLKRLNQLDLSANHISKLDVLAFKGLKGLKSLNLKENQIIEVGDKVFSSTCPSLEFLDLSKNQIYTFSSAVFRNLRKLQSLDLSHNRLTSLTFIRDLHLPILQSLRLDGNDLSKIRENSPFQHLNSLESLSLSGCRLSNMPPYFFKGLSGLKELDLRDNLIETLPSPSLNIKDLRGLSVLWIGSIILREINSDIGHLEGLTELSISGCIHSLPFTLKEDSFRNNTLLKGVNFTSCPGLEYIPDGTFMDLPHLEYLNLRGNALKTISPRIVDWNSLKFIDLELNPFSCDCSMYWIFELPGYDHFRSLIQMSSCVNGKPLFHHLQSIQCHETVLSSHALAVILGSVFGILGLLAVIAIGLWILRRRRSKGSKFNRKKFGKISKHEISVIPRNVSNPAGYKDVLTDESLPLGGNLSNFPDVKTSVL